MPPGLGKMEQVRWKREQAKKKAAVAANAGSE
eukprot:SAG31_NODE_25916_length_451_cov_1.375000_2_plen_31_part_01